jgi:predicted dehydrogenase
MATEVAKELRALAPSGAVLAAVASRAGDRARAFATEHGASAAYDSVDALARDPNVDVVYIATPHIFHAAHTLACLRAGKHVLVEKPFAINATEAAGMITCARLEKRFLMEAMWTRFLPAMVALRTQLDAQAIGRPQLLIGGGAFIPGPAAGHYLFDLALGGGALLDAGVYLISIAEFVFGAPRRIFASGELGMSGVDEHDTWILEFPDGGRACQYVSLRARRAPDIEILGDAGRLHVHAPVFRPTQLTLSRVGHADDVQHHPAEGSGYRYELLEVMQCVRAGRTESAVMPLDETLSIMRTMDEVRRQIGLQYPGES